MSYQAAGKSVGYSSPSSVALVYLLNLSFLLETAVWTTTVSGGEEELPRQSTRAWHSFQIFTKKKKSLEQKSSQILFLKKCELSSILAAGFQQLLFILFTHRVKAEEQKAEDRVLQVSWCESKNYTERK